MQNQKIKSDTAGKVWLVGAGPGDPELLTMKAARLLANATLIVHDGLVDMLGGPDAPTQLRVIPYRKTRSTH